jgi:hypothetical protein
MLVQQLNDDISHDISSLNVIPTSNEIDDNPYANINIMSSFYDYNSFKNSYSNTKKPIILNINIQSLQSKFENLKNYLLNCMNDKIPIYAVALQEIWQIPNPDTLNIPGFSFVFKQRETGRGGGRLLHQWYNYF